MEGRDIAIYTIGGIMILTGIGVGVYLLTKPVKVEKLSTTGDGANNNPQTPPANGNNNNQPATESNGDTPEQVQYDTITYGDHLDTGSFPLVLASKNKLVWDIQNALNTTWGTDLVTDGNMGEDTTKAICSNVFTFCISANPVHRNIIIQKDLYDDIIAGRKRNDLLLPQVKTTLTTSQKGEAIATLGLSQLI